MCLYFMTLKVNKKIGLIKQRLLENLPGFGSQKKMAVIKVNKLIELAFKVPSNPKPSAVSIVLFPYKDDIGFFLTERTHTVDHHKGQISFPGGAQDKNETLMETSLRETKEEIGIDSDLELIGTLSSLYTPVSDFLIHPYIWYADSIPETTLNNNEVSNIFTIPLNDLLDNQIVGTMPKQIKGVNINVPCFHFSNCNCWGATAMILSEFKDILKNL